MPFTVLITSSVLLTGLIHIFNSGSVVLTRVPIEVGFEQQSLWAGLSYTYNEGQTQGIVSGPIPAESPARDCQFTSNSTSNEARG
ncbi:unnamed protein product [Allacma fusca]|uniref:Uncharacterized protein n=1 Tax=Allacma fusca TaxID=39272 RepID=A0A8J2KD64_9HEXA|nr:unnamed protein product [Allacma fusca]